MKTIFLVLLNHDKNAIKNGRGGSSMVRYPIICFNLYSVDEFLVWMDWWRGVTVQWSSWSFKHFNGRGVINNTWTLMHSWTSMGKNVGIWENLQLFKNQKEISFSPFYVYVLFYSRNHTCHLPPEHTCGLPLLHTVPTHGISVTWPLTWHVHTPITQ